MTDCSFNPADMQTAGEALGQVMSVAVLVAVVVGSLIADPLWPFRLVVALLSLFEKKES